jgi:hypothetical protein
MFLETEEEGFIIKHEIGILDRIPFPRLSIPRGKPHPNFVTYRRQAFFDWYPISCGSFSG